jgi:hypothetical protein
VGWQNALALSSGGDLAPVRSAGGHPLLTHEQPLGDGDGAKLRACRYFSAPRGTPVIALHCYFIFSEIMATATSK